MDIEAILQLVTPVIVTITGGGIMAFGRHLKSGQEAIKEKIDDNHSDLESKMLANHALHDREILALKAETKTFMAKDDLDKAFEHDNAARKAIEQSAVYFNAKTTEDIVRLREHVARLDQNDTYLTKEVTALGERMEKSLTKMDEKMDKQGEKIEKIAACVQEIAKKV